VGRARKCGRVGYVLFMTKNRFLLTIVLGGLLLMLARKVRDI